MTESSVPLAVAHDERLAARSIRFRYGDRDFSTIVAKVVLRLVEGADAILLPPEPLIAEDEHYEHDPSKSVRRASELAPRLLATDVILTGNAFQPGGESGPTRVVGLGLHRGGAAIFYKALYVYGDRTVEAPDRVKPFSTMPLVWERAFGGRDVDANPVGVDPTMPRPKALPNLIDPRGATIPASFAPIARYWPLRQRLLGATQRTDIEGDSLRIPEGFSFAYFHAAPQDQRVRFLTGEEWIVLDGMHPILPRVQSRLPGIRALSRLVSARGTVVPIQMMLDMLVIETDRATASLVFRGMTDAAEDGGTFAVAIDIPGAPLVWPDVARPAEPPPPSPPRIVLSQGPEKAATLPMGMLEQLRASSSAPSPYPLPQPRSGAVADLPGAPWGRPAEPVRPAVPDMSTMPLRLEDAPARARALLRAETPAQPSAPVPPIEPPSDPPPPPAPVSFRGVVLEAPPSIDPPVSSVPELETGIRRKVLEKVAAREPLAGEGLAGADLSGLDLEKANFARADLSGTKLAGAALAGARFHEAKLVGADLSKARLDGADFANANLSRAIFSGASLVEASLIGANAMLLVADGANLAKAKLSRAKLDHAVLDRAIVEDADATEADFSGASLERARAARINLSGAHLGDARLVGADLTGSDLRAAQGVGAILRDAILEDAACEGVILERASLDGARLARTKLKAANLRRASLSDARAEEAILEGADLSQSTAERASFARADLSRADLRQAKLSGADLSGAKLSGVQAQKLQAPEIRLEGIDLTGVSFRFARMKGAKMRGAKLDKTDFRDADLEGADLEGVDRTGGIWAGAKV
jgi:uncharacterized protein YjbI with pentapeptide repeats